MRATRRFLPHPVTSGALFVVWLLLNHTPSPGHMVLGAVLAVLLPMFTRRFFPEPVFLGRVVTMVRFVGIGIHGSWSPMSR